MNEDSAPSPELARLFELLALLAERHPSVDGLPPSLTAAAFRGDLDAVELFLSRGARLDGEAVGGLSPLAGAVQSGRTEVVSRLLAAGASPESAGAAAAAAERGCVDLLEILARAGLSPSGAAARNALVAAAVAGNASTMRWLLEHGARPDPMDVRFAAWQADANGHREIAAFLRGERPDLEGVDDHEPPSSLIRRPRPARAEDAWAEERLEEEALAIVASGAADGPGRSPGGQSPLGAAIDARAPRVAAALLDRGADPHDGGSRIVAGREEPHDAPVVTAAATGLPGLVQRLAAGARPIDRNEALVRAASYGLPESVAALLGAGADPAYVTAGGESPLARASGPHRDALRGLVRAEARRRGLSPGPALVSEGARPRTRVGALRGVHEFVASQVRVHPTWAVVAWNRPVDEVTARLASLLGAAGVEIDVARRGVNTEIAGAFVLQLSGQPWTLGLFGLGFRPEGRWEVDERRVAASSRELECATVACEGSDASGTFAAALWDRGLLVERREWAFEAAHREADAWFAARGLFLPGCRVDDSGLGPRLALDRIAPSAVARLDYLVLEA